MAYTNKDIMETLIRLDGRIGVLEGTLTEVKEQTTKTNGRVTKTEEFINALKAVEQYKKDNPTTTQHIQAETVVMSGPKWYENQAFWGSIATISLALGTILAFYFGNGGSR